MDKVKNRDFCYYRFGHLSAFPGLKHFVSSGERSIGFSEGIAPELICHNRELLAKAVGFDPYRWVTGHQVHSDHIAVVTETDAGKGGLDRESRLPDTDALVTNREGICLMVLSADCVPVLLYDPEKRVVAAVHAGWRGTVAGIAGKTVAVMKEKFGCFPGDIWAGIGPSIGQCCFEVGEEVAVVFRTLFSENGELVRSGKFPGKYRVDLWEANRRGLLEAGLQDNRIEVAGMCTVCHPGRFFSYRRESKQAGRFGAGIVLCTDCE